jgi:2-dehydropantoate 2-reductase
MNIGIIGGGSIGLLFAYYLSDQYDVTLYTNTKNQSDEILQNGIYLIHNETVNSRRVKTKWFEHWSGKEDLTIVAVKQYHLENLINLLVEKQTKNTEYVFLQNGMGHLKLLKYLHANTIYVSSVEHGAYKKSSFEVEHNGIGQTKLALYQGEISLPPSLLTIPNFPIILEDDYFEMLVRKLVANAIINPLTGLLKVQNGEIIRNKNYFSIVKNLFREIEAVLKLERGDRYFQQVIEICQKTSGNRSSMLKDLEANRPTEVDAILGYILDEAEMNNIDAPICKTLYHFIKGSEK